MLKNLIIAALVVNAVAPHTGRIIDPMPIAKSCVEDRSHHALTCMWAVYAWRQIDEESDMRLTLMKMRHVKEISL